MPPRGGLKKGMRPMGREAGTPNKATVERAEIARLQNEKAKRAGIKLGKEMLEDYMMAFHNQAVLYQPLPPGAIAPPGRTPDEAKFMEWGKLVVDTANKLAEFQSPKFRAIQVAAPLPPAPEPRTIEGKVVRLDDPVAMGRAYQRLVKQVRG